MGDYATTTSISELLPNFLKSNTTLSDIEGTNIFSRHVTRAEGIINASLAGRYSLPFIVGTTTTNVPPKVRTVAEDIASYFAIRGAYTQDGEIDNKFRNEYKTALEWLEAVRDGEDNLAYTNGSLVPQQATVRFQSTTKNYTPIFKLDEPSSWQVDPDQIDDIANSRD